MLMGYQSSLLDNWISKGNTYIYTCMLMGYQSSLLDNWISKGNTYIYIYMYVNGIPVLPS